MTSLFDDLKEGLQEAIAFAKGEGPARVTRFEIEPVIWIIRRNRHSFYF